MENFIVNADVRQDLGKSANQQLRKSDLVPAIVYGGKKPPLPISLHHNELTRHLRHEAFYSHVLTLQLPGTAEKVILRDLQRHPVKPGFIIHADFQRVTEGENIHVKVPLHFIHGDICVGVKIGGGQIIHNLNEVDIECPPDQLPEFIEVDLTHLNVGETLHLSQLTLPAKVTIRALKHGADHDLPVVTVMPPRGGAADAEAEPAA